MRGPHKIDAMADRTWLEAALGQLNADGFAVISGLLTPDRVETYRDAVFRVREKTIAAVGRQRFEQSVAEGYNELRLPFLFERVFFDLLADARVLALVDAVLGPSAILRFYNAIITPPESDGTARNTGRLHQNFKLPLNVTHGPSMLVEVAISLTTPGQSFRLLRASHKLPEPPSEEDFNANAVPLDWEGGDMMLMSPFIWHREELNLTYVDAVSMFVQFSRPFIKPHADCVRAIDSATWAQLPERTRQLLGSYSQLPVSVGDYYLPADERPYRPGQW
jgi:ectoine hydroxylase-related dioxygenase (phytanoyl-CoA dioxygenase family)